MKPLTETDVAALYEAYFDYLTEHAPPFVPRAAGALHEPSLTGPTDVALIGDRTCFAAIMRPWAPFLLVRVGIVAADAKTSEEFIQHMVDRLGEVTPEQRVRHCLARWLVDFAAGRGVAVDLPPTADEWIALLKAVADQGGVMLALTAPEANEPPSRNKVRSYFERMKPESPRFLRRHQHPDEASDDTATAIIRREFAAIAEQRSMEGRRALEVADAN